MKKILLYVFATILLSSCQDEFIEVYRDAAFWPQRAYVESEYFYDAAGELFQAEHMSDTHYYKLQRCRSNYEDKVKRFNSILKSMDDSQMHFIGVISKINNSKTEKKEAAMKLYREQYYEVKAIVKQCVLYVEDIDKMDYATYRKHRDKLKELNDQVDREFLQKIEAGQNPFK